VRACVRALRVLRVLRARVRACLAVAEFCETLPIPLRQKFSFFQKEKNQSRCMRMQTGTHMVLKHPWMWQARIRDDTHELVQNMAWCGWRETGASMGESLTRSITLHTHTHKHTHTHTSPVTLAQSHMPLEQQLQCRSYVFSCVCVCVCVCACVCISIAHALGTSASVPLRRRRPLLPPRRPAPQI